MLGLTFWSVEKLILELRLTFSKYKKLGLELELDFENFQKTRTFDSPEKGSTRVAGDAAIVHPAFWERLQKTDFQYLSVSTNMYELLPIWTHDSYLSLNT